MATAPAANARRLYVGLVWKIMISTLIAGLVPLFLLAWSAIQGSQTAGQKATQAATQALDSKAVAVLQRQATERAQAISESLNSAVEDTLSAALLPRTAAAYLAFANLRQTTISYPEGTEQNETAAHDRIPRYREIAYIDATGREQVHIQDGVALPADQMRDVSVPANTTYLQETYFSETRALPAGQVYVSHVLAWHTSSGRQPAAAPDPAVVLEGTKYGKYKAVVRFGTPLYTPQGAFDGMVLVSLDARALIDQVIHILPASATGEILWPEAASGNYAFMWDDEGYFIAYPGLANLRGLDATGRLVPPAPADAPAAQKAQFPLTVQNSNLSQALTAVLQAQAPVITNTFQTDAVAPIPFSYGSYSKTGVFGGLAIGSTTSDFHTAAGLVRDSIESESGKFQGATLLIALIALVLLLVAAVLVARSITGPLHRLTIAARSMEQGELDTATLSALLNRAWQDEVTKLTQVFKQMAEQVQLREKSLREKIVELRIEVDQQKRAQQVAELTDNDYFRQLQQKAGQMRARRAGTPESPGPPPP